MRLPIPRGAHRAHFVERVTEIGRGGNGKGGETRHGHTGRADGIVRAQHVGPHIVGAQPAHERTHAAGLPGKHGVQLFVDGAALLARGFSLVHHVEFGIEPGEYRVLLQQARAKSVHGRDVGALQPAANFRARVELLRQLFTHVVGGFIGEGDGQDAQRIDAAFHQVFEVCDQHGGLAGARTGHHASIAGRIFDRGGFQLAVRQFHSASPSAAAARAAR